MIKLLQSICQVINKITRLLCLIATLHSTAYATVTTPDSEQPITIQSDTANFNNQTGIALYIGNVIVDQGSRHLASDQLTIERDASNKVKIMIATGNPATFHSQQDPQKPRGSGKAKIIKYYPQQENVDLLENAELTQNGDTITGPLLNYNFATETLSSKSTATERATCTLQPKRDS